MDACFGQGGAAWAAGATGASAESGNVDMSIDRDGAGGAAEAAAASRTSSPGQVDDQEIDVDVEDGASPAASIGGPVPAEAVIEDPHVIVKPVDARDDHKCEQGSGGAQVEGAQSTEEECMNAHVGQESGRGADHAGASEAPVGSLGAVGVPTRVEGGEASDP